MKIYFQLKSLASQCKVFSLKQYYYVVGGPRLPAEAEPAGREPGLPGSFRSLHMQRGRGIGIHPPSCEVDEGGWGVSRTIDSSSIPPSYYPILLLGSPSPGGSPQ